MLVSVVLPTYNESGNILTLIREIKENIPEGWDHEILVVDDNSPDQTYELVKSTFKDDPKVIPILRTTHRGFAKPIRTGLEKAAGSKIIVMDTDLTHDPIEIPKLLHISKYFEIVSASRFCAGGHMESIRHYLASYTYNLLIRLFLRTQVQDNLGGYYLIDKEKLTRLPFDLIFFGYGEYYFRLLHFAQLEGISMVEIPAFYRTRTSGTSKSRFFHMIFSYTDALIRLKLDAKKYLKPR
jgi:dolichol-phosphate mannosyltransferase